MTLCLIGYRARGIKEKACTMDMKKYINGWFKEIELASVLVHLLYLSLAVLGKLQYFETETVKWHFL